MTRREYRLHRYTIRQYRDPKRRGAGSAASASLSSVAGVVGGATTSIALAFPVSAELTPKRSAHGELVFAYLPVTAAGLPFALHADFELVASRQEVSTAIVSVVMAILTRAPAEGRLTLTLTPSATPTPTPTLPSPPPPPYS